jgi:hypothetical protein
LNSENLKIDFIGLGAPKAGTTWLSVMLDAHPNICLSEPKEVFFFNEKKAHYAKYRMNPNFAKGNVWYSKHFGHCDSSSRIGEFCTRYLVDVASPQRIKSLFPEVKLIVCLREPISRAYSYYNYLRYFLKKEKRDFLTAVKQEPEYTEMGLYHRQLTRYLQYFDRSQLHLIFFEQIKSEPQNLLKKLFGFLEVDEDFMPQKIAEKSNATKEMKFPTIRKVLKISERKVISLGGAKLITAVKKTGIQNALMKHISKNFKAPPMSQDARKYLKEIFKSDTEKLEILLSVDLSNWM